MVDEAKDAKETTEISVSQEVPKELETKTTDESKSETQPESHITKRQEFYKNVNKDENTQSEETEPVVEETKAEETTQEEPEKEDIADRITQKFQKRIGKEVGKRKSAEERATEAEEKAEKLDAELKAIKDSNTSVDKVTAKVDPTDEQIVQFIALKQEEGNFTEAAQAQLFLVEKREKEAIARIEKKQTEKKVANDAQTQKWVSLVQDFVVKDEKGVEDFEHPLNLNNPKSSLYRTAMRMIQDKEIASAYGYNNPDKVLGFRLAVNDARRDLMELAEQGKLDLNAHKPKKQTTNNTQPKIRRKSELATVTTESTSSETTPGNQTSEDKTTLEIARRKELKNKRLGLAV